MTEPKRTESSDTIRMKPEEIQRALEEARRCSSRPPPPPPDEPQRMTGAARTGRRR